MYARIDPETGEILQYPYSITALVRSRKDVCWPRVISDELAASYGVVKVADAQPPAEEDDEIVEELPPTIVEGELRRQYLKRTLTADEFTARRQARAKDVRDRRDERLTACDWTQLLDTPANVQTAWAAYRVLLRDVPQQAGFPFTVTWPTKP